MPEVPSTATLADARQHARSQAGADSPRSGGLDSTLLWDETVPGGNYATHRLPRDAVLRLRATQGDTCVALVVHRAAQPIERLNVADTVKVQWQAYPTSGTVLLSDMGRALMTVVEDSCPPRSHDALCGATTATSESARSGADPGAWTATPSARALLLAGLAKHGLGRRDLPPCLNLFGGAEVESDGAIRASAPVGPGSTVALRCEVDVIVTFAVVLHPLDPRPGSDAGPVHALAQVESRPSPDPLRSSTPERNRAFDNTEESLLGGLR
jgi:uncharacterized protein